jgi:hypothetical protein
VINLRIDTPETRALGAELHVCELQLLLQPIAALLVQICFVCCILFSGFALQSRIQIIIENIPQF